MAVFTLNTFWRRAFGLRDATALSVQGDTYSGKAVNGTTALSISTVFACVRLISQSIASLPCGLYAFDAQGDKVLQKDNELYTLFHDRPNANMSAFSFWQAIVGAILLWGNAYGLKVYQGTGAKRRLISVEPLPPECVTLKQNKDGSLSYVYTDYITSSGQKEYSENEIIHFKGFGVSGRIGLSVIAFARQSLGNALALEETSGRLYANGMRPGGALTIPNVLKQEQRDEIRKSIADQIGGVAKSGGTIILEAGMKYEPLSMPPEDAQMLESKTFSVEEICRWFGVPPVLIGHNGVTTWGTGIEQINLGFLTYTIQPMLENIEQEVNRSGIPVDQRSKYFVEFNTTGFLRSDSAGRAALYSSGSQNGWMTRAEIRRRENLPYIEGSDELTVQSALVPLDKLGESADGKTIEDSSKV